MRKITLDIEDSHFAAFEAMARVKNVDPLEIIATQLKQTASILEQVRLLTADSLETRISREFAALNFLNLAAWADRTDFNQRALGEAPTNTLEGRRAARLAILQQGGPLWEGEPGKPKDGLVYEQELRAEW